MNEWSFFLCKIVESKMAHFKMATIIKLSENEWVKFLLFKMVNSRWQNSRCLTSSSWVRMNVFESDWISLSQSYVQNGWIQDGTFQDGLHHHVRGEWMSLSQIELVWVRVRVEWECFWVYLREDNKVSESKMAVAESNMAEFRMAAIIKLSQNEWVKFFFVQNVWIQEPEFKMDDIIKLSENEWVKFFCSKWLNPRWQNSRWLTSSS